MNKKLKCMAFLTAFVIAAVFFLPFGSLEVSAAENKTKAKDYSKSGTYALSSTVKDSGYKVETSSKYQYKKRLSD